MHIASFLTEFIVFFIHKFTDCMGSCCTCSSSSSSATNKLFLHHIYAPFTTKYTNLNTNSPLFSDHAFTLRSTSFAALCNPIPVTNNLGLRRRRRFRICFSNSGDEQEQELKDDDDDGGGDNGGGDDGVVSVSPEYKAIISACLVGLFTGLSVVLFNVAVDEIRDIFWDGIPDRGASWLREEPIQVKWVRVISVPACGGVLVSLLNLFQNALDDPNKNGILTVNVKATLEPVYKALAACVTLGTGNSLGPEGPSVDIGTSVAQGVGTLFDNGNYRKLSLKAAGSAAGIASGFNAAVAGCFFAVESVLWPAPAGSSSSLTNTTSMVILSAVIASVVAEIGLGTEPSFTVPNYDFRSPSELPLYLLLGTVCGLVSVSFSRCTTFMMVAVDNVQKASSVPKAVLPIFGGLSVGLIALAYPEILFWGFENVDILLESRPFVEGISVELLLQLVAVKIFATSLSRASGLVGGYYAPSLFIGAATGMAYGKIVSNPILHLTFLEVASPQAYGLVGMAATLAGVCQVPLTAVLLLFELTQDYRIVLPLLGAVGLSSWITSGLTRTKRAVREPNDGTSNIAKRILVADAMRTKFVTVLATTSIAEAVSLMLAEKQPCAVIVDDKNTLIGLINIAQIHRFTENTSSAKMQKSSKELLVSDLCRPDDGGEGCELPLTVTPNMTLFSAQTMMNKYGVTEVAVVLDHHQYYSVGVLDDACISLACRGFTIGKRLRGLTTKEIFNN